MPSVKKKKKEIEVFKGCEVNVNGRNISYGGFGAREVARREGDLLKK